MRPPPRSSSPRYIDRRLTGRDRPLRLTELHTEPTWRRFHHRGDVVAAVADAHARLEREVGGRSPGDPRRPVGDESPACQQLLRPYDDAVVRRIDLEHVGRFAQGDAEPPPLPDREPERAVVLAEDPAVGVDHLAPGCTSAGACDRTNPPASPLGAKHSSCESGFIATGRPNRSACARVWRFGMPPTGNNDRASWPCPSMWSMYD